MTTEALARIYKDPKDPGSLGGVDRLFRSARAQQLDVTRAAVRDFLGGQQAYTLHRPARRHYLRNHIYVGGIDGQWQADLADMQGIARQNDGMRYILTVIDVFSKYAWVSPVKSKSAEAVTDAFRTVLQEAAPRVPRRLQTDKGTEFFNAPFAALMRRHGIQHFASESDQKAAVAERFNKTIKSRIYTYLSDRGTVRWVDVVQDLVHGYNNSVHRTIGMRPKDVRPEMQDRLWARMYGDGDTYRKPSIPVGSMVRLNKIKRTFEKGYMPNWTKEHFVVRDVPARKKMARRPVYKLEDYEGEEMKGTYYPEEIEKIRDNQYRIERVLRRRTLPDGTREKFVQWEGWPEKYNSWIREEDVYNVAQ